MLIVKLLLYNVFKINFIKSIYRYILYVTFVCDFCLFFRIVKDKKNVIFLEKLSKKFKLISLNCEAFT